MTDTPQHDSTRSTRHTVVVPNSIDMVSLLGPGDEHLGLIERAFSADVHVRGNRITLTVTCRHDQSLRDQLPAFEGQEDRYVVWGEGTTDEMCLGILLVTRP